MTPHDIEHKLYNDLMKRILQLEDQLVKVFSACKKKKVDTEIEDGVFLCSVWILDVKEKFNKYSELP